MWHVRSKPHNKIKVFWNCPKSLVSKGLRLGGPAPGVLNPCRQRTYGCQEEKSLFRQFSLNYSTVRFKLTLEYFAGNVGVNRFTKIVTILSICGKLLAWFYAWESAFHMCVRSFVLSRYAIAAIESLNGNREAISTNDSGIIVPHRGIPVHLVGLGNHLL